jgi:competence protein ComEC
VSATPARGVVDWFVHRAGLARFTTFACALGLALSAMTGARPAVAMIGLMVALAGAIGGAAWRGQRASCSGPGLLIVSVLLVGLFGGHLVGNLRVTQLMGGTLQSRIGDVVQGELCVTGQVRSNGGWQSATAVVRSLSGAAPSNGAAPTSGAAPAVAAASPDAAPAVDAASPGAEDSAVGETVLLEVAPDEGTPNDDVGTVVLSQGMIIALRGTIETPEGPSDSGYDQAKQLLHQGIEVVLRANGSDSISVLGRRGGVAGWFDRLRMSAKAHLSRGPDTRVNEVLQGVVMGDTVGIDEDWLTAFRRSGTAHMLSVSGLHVAALAAIMIGLARLLRAARWVGFLLASVSALLMIPFVGASPPIIRSAAMICVVLVGRWVGRGRDQWQVLALAAVVVLALNPFAVFDVGFQLSFAAFVGMLVLLGPLQKLLRRLPSAIASNVAVSIAASAGTAPVALVVFDKTSLVSPLANLLVVPTLPLVTGLGMASVFLGFAWPGLSTALDTVASLPMMWTVQVSRLMAVAPVLNAADLGRVLFALTTGAVVLPAALALTGRSVRTPFGLPLPLFKRSVGWLRARRPRNRRRAAGLGVAVALLGFVVGAAAYPPVVGGVEALEAVAHGGGWPDQVEVRVLDVGQGNAVLVRTPERHTLLFDGGPAGCDLAGQLRELGVRKIDLVVISHPHADHFAGLLEALGGLEVEALIDQVQVVSRAGGAAGAAARAAPTAVAGGAGADGDPQEAAEYLELRRELAEDGCRCVLGGAGYAVTVDGVVVRFFAPGEPLVLVDGGDPWAAGNGEPSGDELNGSSLVAVVSIGSVGVLIPGDAEAEVLQGYGLPATEVVVVPHHGSRGAVSDQLLREWGTRVAFISVGADNSFGHPYAGTVSVLEETVKAVLRTDTAGWVSCKVNGDQMVITTERTPTR